MLSNNFSSNIIIIKGKPIFNLKRVRFGYYSYHYYRYQFEITIKLITLFCLRRRLKSINTQHDLCLSMTKEYLYSQELTSLLYLDQRNAIDMCIEMTFSFRLVFFHNYDALDLGFLNTFNQICLKIRFLVIFITLIL